MQSQTSQEIISKISNLFGKIDQGNLNENELEALVKLSSDLHERCVILRYKSFEQKVFKKVEVEEVVKSEPAAVKTEVKKPQVVAEQTPIDFSIFDEQESVEEVEETPTISFEEEKEELPVEIKSPEIAEESPAPSTETEEITKEATNSSDCGTYVHNIANESKGGIHQKIENLSSSFGLNERMLYTNELFDGSSESFSNTLDLLDNLSNWEEAKSGLVRLAELNDWQKETKALDGFIAHIYRCYA